MPSVSKTLAVYGRQTRTWLLGRDIIRENKRGECEATKNEVRMLERMVDEERVERKDIPSIVGKSYRQCVDENVFDKIDTLKRQGIYSRLSALLMAYKNKENK